MLIKSIRAETAIPGEEEDLFKTKCPTNTVEFKLLNIVRNTVRSHLNRGVQFSSTY